MRDVCRVALIAAWGLALAVLVVAFVAIAGHTGNPWPWFEIVHENGDRTLAGTVFFFEHTARELPLDLILGAAVGASALFVFSRRGRGESSWRPRRRAALIVALSLVAAVIIGGTLWVGGWPMLEENLLQYPTRPGAPAEWGGHWRYHFLSHVMLMAVALGLGGVLVVLSDPPRKGGYDRGLKAFRTTAAWFAGLTVIFVPNLDPFLNPLVIGHQVRESLTHGLVTVPAAWGTCLWLAKAEWGSLGHGAVSFRGALIAGAVGVVAGLYLLVVGLATSAASQGQSDSLVILLFPHFFEHTFSYVVAGLAAGLVYEW